MKVIPMTKYTAGVLMLLCLTPPLAAQNVPVPVAPVAPPGTMPVPVAPLSPAPYATQPLMPLKQKTPLGGRDILNALQVAPGVWWNDEGMIAKLGLTTDQRRKMDEILQQHRIQLIDLNAALDKEELVLEPLVAAPTLDQAKIIAQIDRVAAARAELEKANARLLLGLQQALTPEQRAKLPRNTATKKYAFF